MKIFIVLLALAASSAQATPHLSRQWVRSTLSKQHLGFRYLNRMPPLLTEEHVIQGNGVDGIKVFHRRSGNEVWRLNFTNGVEGGAAISGDKLYFGAGDGQFYCVEVATGKKVWQFALNSESLTKPLVQGNSIYHVTGNNTLYAFDKETGRSLWVKTNAAKSNMTVRGQTAPVYEKGVLYLGFSDGSFVAINAQNGRELWSKRLGDDKKFNDVDATAVISSSCILVSSFANSLFCLNKTNGNIKWRHDVGGYNAVYLDRNRVYYPTASGEIHLLDADSGKLLKKVVNLRGLSTEIVGFQNFIIYGESSGALVIRDKASLDRIHAFYPGRGLFARPTVDDESKEIYFISNQANLFRVDLKFEPENPFKWSSN